MDNLFPYGNFAHWVSGSGFVITIWFGAYIATHVPRRFHSRLAYISLFALSVYFLHTTLCLFLPAQQAGYLWRRYMGWIALAPLPLWFHLTSSLLQPQQHKKQWILYRTFYLLAAILAATWIIGDWSFSRETLLPPELVIPITLFILTVGSFALNNIFQQRKLAIDHTLKLRNNLLGIIVILLMASVLYWPIAVNWLKTPWSPTLRLAIGDAIPLTAVLVLAYSVAFQNMFMSGKWVRQDFFYHAFSISAFAGLYLFTMLAAYRFSVIYNFDTPTLVLISIVGLSVLTHMMADTSRRIWDNLFIKNFGDIRKDMRSLVTNSHSNKDSIQGQMRALVNRLKELTSASMICVAMFEEADKLIVRASTDPLNNGRNIPTHNSSQGPVPAIGINDTRPNDQLGSDLLDCLVLAEPIRVNNQIEGYLLLGDRGVSEKYDREERVWISGLAAHLGTALEKEKQLNETADLISELEAEVKYLQNQRKDMEQEFDVALMVQLPSINRYELKECIYAYNKPKKLQELLDQEGSSLAELACILHSEEPVPKAIQICLDKGLKSLIPPDGLPDLESLQHRSLNSKKRRHLPSPVANYYTLQLVMAGYTHEDIAEKLDVSARQVRNYLDRATSLVQAFLEDQAHTKNLALAANPKNISAFLSN